MNFVMTGLVRVDDEVEVRSNDQHTTIQFVVGDEIFPLTMKLINEHPNSYFASAIKPPWNDHDSRLVKIDRDVELFREVYTFMTESDCAVFQDGVPLQFILAVKREADYFDIPDLVSLCDQLVFPIIQTWCTDILPSLNVLQEVPVHQSRNVQKILGHHYYPSCMQGALSIENEQEMKLFKHSSLGNIILKEFVRNAAVVNQEFSIQNIAGRIPTLPRIKSYVACPTIRPLILSARSGHLSRYSASAALSSRGSIGVVYYILQAATSGGDVEVRHSGARNSIREKNEYIVALAGHHLNIEEVTSGTLIMFTGTLTSDFLGENYEEVAPLPDTLYPDLVKALQVELLLVGGVALCLTKYYPISDIDDNNLGVEGDPDVLQAVDASLYAYLTAYFTVTVVTVFILREHDKCRACVLNTSFIGESTKFIVPTIGYGEVLDGRKRDDFRTLVTAFYIQLKESV